MDREKLEILIKQALDMLYKRDYFLICNRPLGSKKDRHVSERGIVFRFGLYFHQLLNELNDEYFDELSLDVEYNRNLKNCKRVPSRENGAIPDMILHKRGDNDNNLLIMEFKTWWNTNISDDIIKIKDFMNPNNGYSYKFGACISIRRNSVKITWVDSNGNTEFVRYQPNI